MDEPPAERAVIPADDDEGGDDIIFSSSEQEIIKRLKEESLMTRLACFYHTKHKRDLPLIRRPFEELTSDELLTILQTYTVFGTKRWPTCIIGSLNQAIYKDYKDVPVHIIRASIVGPKVHAVETFSDVTLVSHLKGLLGTIVRDSGKIGEVEIIPPGWNKVIRVSSVAPTVGQVLGGASDYLEWRKETQSKPYEYKAYPPDIRVIARYYAARYVLTIKDKVLSFEARSLPSKNATKLDLLNPTLSLARYDKPVLAALSDAYANPTFRPNGMSVKDSPTELIGWLLSSLSSTWEEGDQTYFATCAQDIRVYGRRVMEGIDSLALAVTPKALATNKPTGLPITTYTKANIKAYVEKHRSTLRAIPSLDMTRKSDAPKLGRVAGEASSVAEKYARAISFLQEGPKFVPYTDKADVFGVAEGWMIPEVRKAFNKVSWFDKEPRKEDTGEHVDRKDIFSVSQGEGRGKTLIDNTHVPDPAGKLVVVERGEYDRFVLKMEFGAGDDGTIMVGADLVPKLGSLLEKYDIRRVEGGAAHSPEYFLVGTKYSEAPSEDDVQEAWYDLVDGDVDHAVRMVRQNILRSAQVWAGVWVEDPKWVIHIGSAVKELLLGGTVGPKSPTVDLKSTPAPARMARASRYASEDGDPEVRPQINGNNGEATNTDDVNLQWVSESTVQLIGQALRYYESQVDVLLNVYPMPLAIGMAWSMLPPIYGGGKGIKLGGKRLLPGAIPVYHFSGVYLGGVIHAFELRTGGPRMCIYMKYVGTRRAPEAKGAFRVHQIKGAVALRDYAVSQYLVPRTYVEVVQGDDMIVVKKEEDE